MFFEEADSVGDTQVLRFGRNGIHIIPGSQDTSFAGPLPPIFFTQPDENGVVRYSTNGLQLDTLYYFGGEVGDSWRTSSGISIFTDDTIKVVILENFTVDLNGSETFAQRLQYIYETRGGTSVIDTVLSSVGNLFLYINPFDLLFVEGGEGGAIRCYEDDDLGLITFSNPSHISFEYTCPVQATAIQARIAEAPHRVLCSPNPARTSTSVSGLPEPLPTTTGLIYASHGTFAREVDLQTPRVDISGLSPGIYFLIVPGVGRSRFVKI